jgi:hypothetical protein
MLSIFPIKTNAATKNDAAVYFKDGTVERGELVWISDDKVSLRKNGELWEFEKNEVLLNKTIKHNRLDEKTVAPKVASQPKKPIKHPNKAAASNKVSQARSTNTGIAVSNNVGYDESKINESIRYSFKTYYSLIQS